MVTGLTIGITFLVAVFTALQYSVARNQARQAQVQLMRAVSDEWRSLGQDWELAMMIGRGVGSFYVRVPPQVQAFYSALKKRSDTWYSSEENKQPVQLTEVETAVAGLSYEEVKAQLDQYEDSCRRIVEFLARAGGRVLGGDLPVELVYDAFGALILNSAGPIRNIVNDDPRFSWIIPGQKDLVIALVDLLWAYGVKVGDLDPQDWKRVAEHKRRSGSGLFNRLRVRRLARRRGGAISTMRLEYLLTFAETGRASIYSRLLTYARGRVATTKE